MTVVYVTLAWTCLLAGVVYAWAATIRAHEQRVDDLLQYAYAERVQATSGFLAAISESAQHDPHPDLAALVDLVDRLCQRLQAPETAIVDHQLSQQMPYMPQAVNPEGPDDEFWEAHDISKETLAEQLAEQEFAARQG